MYLTRCVPPAPGTPQSALRHHHSWETGPRDVWRGHTRVRIMEGYATVVVNLRHSYASITSLVCTLVQDSPSVWATQNFYSEVMVNMSLGTFGIFYSGAGFPNHFSTTSFQNSVVGEHERELNNATADIWCPLLRYAQTRYSTSAIEMHSSNSGTTFRVCISGWHK